MGLLVLLVVVLHCQWRVLVGCFHISGITVATNPYTEDENGGEEEGSQTSTVRNGCHLLGGATARRFEIFGVGPSRCPKLLNTRCRDPSSLPPRLEEE